MAATEPVVANLRVDYLYEDESRTWCFVVPSLGIVGGAESRPAAQQEAVAAIAFTLEGEASDATVAGGESGDVRIIVQG